MSGGLQNSVRAKSKRLWTRSPQPQLLPEISAFSDKTQPLEVERPGPVFHNAEILLYHGESLDLTQDQASTLCAAAVAKKLSSSICYMFCFPQNSPTQACGKLSIVEGEKTNIGDRDLLPQRSFSFNIKHWGNRWVRIRAFYDVFFKVGFNLRRTLASPD